MAGVSHDRQTAKTRNNFAQEVKALVGDIGFLERKSGDVTARPRQTRDQAAADGVSRHSKNDRDHGCRLLSRRNGGSSIGDDNVDVEPNELRRKFGIALAAALRIPIFNRKIATFDPAELAQPLHKSSDPLTFGRRRGGPQVTDSRQLPRLLRPHRERPHRRAAEQRDELAPPHSMTSSARARSVGGTSMPSALAVLRLTTSSYFVGACTGRSAGFSPLRMRST